MGLYVKSINKTRVKQTIRKAYIIYVSNRMSKFNGILMQGFTNFSKFKLAKMKRKLENSYTKRGSKTIGLNLSGFKTQFSIYAVQNTLVWHFDLDTLLFLTKTLIKNIGKIFANEESEYFARTFVLAKLRFELQI